MRKIFTLFAAMVCSMTMFAQSLQLETKSGRVIANGSTVTVEGEMIDLMQMGMLEANLYVRNLTETGVSVVAQMKSVSGESQFCFGGSCTPIPVGTISAEKSDAVLANSAISLAIESVIMEPVAGKYFSRTIEVIAWVKGSPDDKVSAIVTFTNDPAAANIESTEVQAASVFAKGNVLYYSFANAADRQLQVFDVTGHIQKDIRLNSEAGSFSLEGMTKGLYIYRVAEAGKKIVSGKFLVK